MNKFASSSQPIKIEKTTALPEIVPKTGENLPTSSSKTDEFKSVNNEAANKQKRGLCVGFDCCGCHWWV